MVGLGFEGLLDSVFSVLAGCFSERLIQMDGIEQRSNVKGYRNNTIDSRTVSDCVEAVSVCDCDAETHGSRCFMSLTTMSQCHAICHACYIAQEKKQCGRNLG